MHCESSINHVGCKCKHRHLFSHCQGSTCLDGGAYLLNYVGCHQCKQKGFLAEKEKVREEDEDGEELVTYKREIRLVHLYHIVGHSVFIVVVYSVVLLFNVVVYSVAAWPPRALQ